MSIQVPKESVIDRFDHKSLKLNALLNAQAVLKRAKIDESPTIVDPNIDAGSEILQEEEVNIEDINTPNQGPYDKETIQLVKRIDMEYQDKVNNN